MGALIHIDQSLVGFVPGLPEFEQLVSDTLGNAADPSDGFDSDLAAVMQGVAVTDALLDATDLVFGDVVHASAVFDSIDTAGLVEDFNQGAPVIDAFAYDLKLKTVGALNLPAPAPAPAGGPPLQVCFPAPPAPTPAPCPPGQSFVQGACVSPPVPIPAPPTHPPIPIPPIYIPAPAPCPPGFISTQSGDCIEQPAPPAPTPAPAPIPDCPPGSMFIQYPGSDPVCRPISGGPSTPPTPAPGVILCPPGSYFSYTRLACIPCDPISFEFDISIAEPGSGACLGQMPQGGADCTPFIASSCPSAPTSDPFMMPPFGVF